MILVNGRQLIGVICKINHKWLIWLGALLAGTLVYSVYQYHFWMPPKGSNNLDAQQPLSSAGFHMTDVDCARVLAGDQKYIDERVKQRGTMEDPEELDVSCEAIHARHPTLATEYPGNDGAEYPIAMARAVYMDYLFLEAELATNYAPHNWYCYAIDQKTDYQFVKRMRALAECLPNVMLTKKRYPMDRYGKNMWKSMLECLQMHSNVDWNYANVDWNYAINLQNWDLQLKTNEELVQIFKWYNGTNDIQYTHIGEHWVNFQQKNWTLAHLHLFKNESKNAERDSDGNLLELKKTKGQVQNSLSRPFVEWLINDLNTGLMLDQLNSYVDTSVIDEVFIPTLAANEFLKAPAGFTRHCYGKTLAPGMTRFYYFIYDDSPATSKCQSKINRHNLCIFGLEDLIPNLFNNPFLFANKVLPSRDADVIQCWHEVMRNRTFGEQGVQRLRKELHRELPQIRFNELTKRNNGHMDLEQFNCTYKYLDDVKYGQEWFQNENKAPRRGTGALLPAIFSSIFIYIFREIMKNF